MRCILILGIIALILGQGCSSSRTDQVSASKHEYYTPLIQNPSDCLYCMGRGNMGEPISSCGWCRGTGLKPSAQALKELPPPAKKSSGRIIER